LSAGPQIGKWSCCLYGEKERRGGGKEGQYLSLIKDGRSWAGRRGEGEECRKNVSDEMENQPYNDKLSTAAWSSGRVNRGGGGKSKGSCFSRAVEADAIRALVQSQNSAFQSRGRAPPPPAPITFSLFLVLVLSGERGRDEANMYGGKSWGMINGCECIIRR